MTSLKPKILQEAFCELTDRDRTISAASSKDSAKWR